MFPVSLIVAGSRSFKDYDRMAKDLDYLLSKKDPEDIEIVHGGCATGADALAAQYAAARGYRVTVFEAHWKAFGRAAGPMRNDEMAMYGHALVAYWDGESAGTKNMIRCARLRGLRVVVRRF